VKGNPDDLTSNALDLAIIVHLVSASKLLECVADGLSALPWVVPKALILFTCLRRFIIGNIYCIRLEIRILLWKNTNLDACHTSIHAPLMGNRVQPENRPTPCTLQHYCHICLQTVVQGLMECLSTSMLLLSLPKIRSLGRRNRKRTTNANTKQ
jgi:hypothetical protein